MFPKDQFYVFLITREVTAFFVNMVLVRVFRGETYSTKKMRVHLLEYMRSSITGRRCTKVSSFAIALSYALFQEMYVG
jgi:hypothetical protein